MRRGGLQKQMLSRKKILYTFEASKVYKGHNGDVMIIIQGQNYIAKNPKKSSTNNQRALFATTAGQPIPHLPPCRTISHASAPISSAQTHSPPGHLHLRSSKISISEHRRFFSVCSHAWGMDPRKFVGMDREGLFFKGRGNTNNTNTKCAVSLNIDRKGRGGGGGPTYVKK